MDKKKAVEEMLKNYTTNVVIIKNIDLEIETINLCDNRDPKEIDRLNHIKKQKQFEVKKVNNMLEGLKDRELKIIEMRYFHRYKLKDIAVELDLNCNYVYCLKFKIINKLADSIICFPSLE
ncbi:sigma factor-like helix-turn-helix DNA-binding protein [Clostridium sp. AWRP]|uniref:sigma factor-like helix-turn-helix DNA-binding protein n=1 Tax=Clostridium sp. AWRP TaxID=2212991 RepID=UPI000FD82659|nr:sigma factor-like helix-turn-helix DNA-binding protein [Clostridium sp. AWRP]AZV58940.1 sigma-70 family RNA polymerase sigma factor [Clostridium sp. AWRP]